jgi:hypothetical protein
MEQIDTIRLLKYLTSSIPSPSHATSTPVTTSCSPRPLGRLLIDPEPAVDSSLTLSLPSVPPPLRSLPLLKKFIVPAGNLFLVPPSESDILCRIQKINHFWCRLLSTDTKDPSLVSAVITQLIQKKLIYGVDCPSIADTINLCLR